MTIISHGFLRENDLALPLQTFYEALQAILKTFSAPEQEAQLDVFSENTDFISEGKKHQTNMTSCLLTIDHMFPCVFRKMVYRRYSEGVVSRLITIISATHHGTQYLNAEVRCFLKNQQ